MREKPIENTPINTDQPVNRQIHSYHLTIYAKDQVALMERLLRVVRHRGFEIKKFQADLSADEIDARIQMTVNSERPISLLCHQLEKLWDVEKVVSKQLN